MYPGPWPGLRRGRTRSGARYPASVFCAGVLCGSCVAPRSPRGPPRWRRELVPRGAARRGTDAGPLAGLNECAFNPLCVCGRGSSAPTRVLSDSEYHRQCCKHRHPIELPPSHPRHQILNELLLNPNGDRAHSAYLLFLAETHRDRSKKLLPTVWQCQLHPNLLPLPHRNNQNLQGATSTCSHRPA